ncbi:hypothetical protein ACFSE0_19595 [Ochrobactrum teleogrylli]|uniref:Adenylate cyclase n=1 Tax=Ochrobactrum teleogrylli TaxID=2479765 RepID=A0ABY2Y150_9HYPH|nr:hypothetical protein [[Ochrobactrum] teleogrylli]TNV11531.1 hypothetical protein FIC94_18630 [[Ochrobactrum] teleogrylli]
MLTAALEWSVPILLFLCGIALIVAAKLNATTIKWGVGLCLLGVGYSLMLIRTESFSAIKPLGEDLLILSGIAICCHAFASKFKLRVISILDALIIFLSLATAAFSLFYFQSVRLESLSILIGCAFLLLSYLSRVKFGTRIASELILIFVFSLAFLCLLVQAAAYIFVQDVDPKIGLWSNSIWGVFLQYTGLFGGLILALSVLLTINLDIIAAYRDRISRVPDTLPLSKSRALDQSSATVEASVLHSGAEIMHSSADFSKTSTISMNGVKQREVEQTEFPDMDEAIRACLAKLTSAAEFSRSPRARKFLIYIVEETLSGRADRIKEYTIALDVFDRKSGHDLAGDSLVRTSAKRLRQSLDAYNNGKGKLEPIHIAIPKGSYIPKFFRNIPSDINPV